MSGTTTKPSIVTGQVLTTTQYELFKSIDGNRNLNLLHYNRLLKSMEERCLFTVIIVNERKEIIDGQHRYEVLKTLKLPLNYIICKGYGLSEVHRFNTNSKTWTADDYLAGYCDMGYTDYLKYKAFKDLYRFGHRESMSMLAGNVMSKDAKIFYEGKFKIKNYKAACDIADKIMMIQPYFEGYQKSSFVLAMISLFKNPNFEFTEFLQKLKLQPTALQPCANTEMYKTLIEEIYNYRRKNKINLRYI